MSDELVACKRRPYVAHVTRDLCDELIKYVEAFLYSEVAVQRDLDEFAVELAVEIEEVGLDETDRGVRVEGLTGSDADRSEMKCAVFAQRGSCEDAVGKV
jgi:hypothetical protein